MPMLPSFIPIQTLPFEAWKTMWLPYVATSASSSSTPDPQATYAKLVHPEINLHGIAAVLDHAVGFAHFYYHASTWSTEDNCHLQDLYVAPEARGQKMGKALIEAVAVEARRRGCSVLHWRTRQSNTSAQALYSQFAQRMDFVSYRLAL